MKKEQITAAGITYDVLTADTPETFEDRGLTNLAESMRKMKATRHLGIRRPKGQVLYTIYEYKNGKYYGDPINCGRITRTSRKNS